MGKGQTGGADFGGEDLEDEEHEGLLGLHEDIEVVSGDEADLCTGPRDGGEGIGLVANERGDTEGGACDCLAGKKVLVSSGVHGESGFALTEDEEAGGRISLAKEDAVFFAGERSGALFKSEKELGFGDER